MGRKKTARKAKTGRRRSGSRAELARKRGHKPVALLKVYHSKMEKNLGRLENLIRRREAAGE
jgi:hypothetical protein